MQNCLKLTTNLRLLALPVLAQAISSCVVPAATPQKLLKMDAHKESLVAQIKELQRSDVMAKQQWGFYCTQNGGGIRDPSKHEADFIHTFLEQYSAGTLVVEESHGENELTQCIKTAQQKSRAFSNAWKAYCATRGKGVNDPLKHEPGFLQEFLTFVGDQAQMALAMNGGGGGGGWSAGPPAKRFKGAGGGMGGGMGGGFGGGMGGMGGLQALLGAMGGGGAMGGAMGGMDPVKDGLVNKIKTFQRSGQECKELWWAHCDNALGGVRDPAKHSAGVLRAFLSGNGIN